MKKLVIIILLLLPIITIAQYSNYYQVNSNVNVNANINKNVNVTGTVTTIDYGSLANANAQREANRVSRQQYANQRAKDAAIAIANDPSKAYDYGTDNPWKADSKTKKKLGWDRNMRYMYHKVPNSSLFVRTGGGYTYENTSDDGVKTQIIITAPHSVKKGIEINSKFFEDIEEMFEYKSLNVGELNDLNSNGKSEEMLHKIDLKRANIGGVDGFRGTLIWEDKYEKCITDNYASNIIIKGKKYRFFAKVRFKGDGDEVSFEQLEGRRYYFRPLINKMLSTIKIY